MAKKKKIAKKKSAQKHRSNDKFICVDQGNDEYVIGSREEVEKEVDRWLENRAHDPDRMQDLFDNLEFFQVNDNNVITADLETIPTISVRPKNLGEK